jgi:glyoxylase-like metal-dependent hydrolase (beta-lactamase superfamily II)
LYERTGLTPEAIDTVFLTNFRPSHRAGLSAFPRARVLIHETERETIRPQLEQMRESIGVESEDARTITHELAILEACEAAPDKLVEGVDIFPLPGFTPGNCGLLISLPTLTVLLASDAVATQEHFLAAQVLPESYDVKQAGESLREAYEIADMLIPGHDNIFINPRTQGL